MRAFLEILIIILKYAEFGLRDLFSDRIDFLRFASAFLTPENSCYSEAISMCCLSNLIVAYQRNRCPESGRDKNDRFSWSLDRNKSSVSILVCHECILKKEELIQEH
jgi:hypothetical protein